MADTAGAIVVSKIIQARDNVDSQTYIGKGKTDFITKLVEELRANAVIFDNELSPAQNRNLEKAFNCKVLDRTALILDIFALHARSKEAHLQVELAQLQYMLPRLTRMWTHLTGSQGGIGFRGPGETQLEVDRRVIGKKISEIKEKLLKIEQQRDIQRKTRGEMFRVSLVGYTNAGKSTLLNALSDANVYVEDKLFATLDTTTRQVVLDENQKILLSDTVGFIRHLPHKLVASFRATLDEVRLADLLLHVVDGGSINYQEQIGAVNAVLEGDLGLTDKPILMVFNKADATDADRIAVFSHEFPGSVAISAKTGLGLAALRQAIQALVQNRLVEKTFKIPHRLGNLIEQIHSRGNVIKTEYEEDGASITAVMEKTDAERILKVLSGN